MKYALLFLVFIGVCGYMMVQAVNISDVVYSYSTKQCVQVINSDATSGSCNKIPLKYNKVWTR